MSDNERTLLALRNVLNSRADSRQTGQVTASCLVLTCNLDTFLQMCERMHVCACEFNCFAIGQIHIGYAYRVNSPTDRTSFKTSLNS